jgi:VanZ family protein
MKRKMVNILAVKRLTLLLMLLSVLAFIFGNSLEPLTVSGATSKSLYDFLSRIFGSLPFFTHPFLRKAAHFAEYALLGACLFFVPSTFWDGRVGRYPMALLSSLPVALADEGLQYFSSGRNPSLWDVLLDFSGAAFAFFVCLSVVFLYARFKKKSRGGIAL